MATVDDTAIAIADEYAEAALELAGARGVADDLVAELGELAGFVESDAEFGGFMASPVIDPEDRRDVLERVLRGKMSDLALNTILVLNGKGRAELVPLLHQRCELALARSRNEIEVQVTPAHPLNAELREHLIEMLAQRTGKKPRLVERLDPATIAGVRVQIEDQVLDCSAASYLRRMQQSFLERAARELQTQKLPIEDK